MGNNPTLTPSEVSGERLMVMLDALETTTRSAKFFHAMGVDTEFVQKFRAFVSDPATALDKMSEQIPRAFVALFWELLKEGKASESIDSIGAEIRGSKASMWIYLKDEQYTYENRAKVYSLKAELIGVLKKADIDVMILRKSEAELPKEFNRIELA